MKKLLGALPVATLVALLSAGAATAQTSSIEGVVKGEDGAPLKDALIKIDRKDIKGHYEVKTKKKGDYLHAGLPLGTYTITCWVNGQEVDKVDNVRTRLGDPTPVNFDLQEMKRKRMAMQKAAETGTMTQEQARDMSPEQKAAIEKAMKERSAAMAKNKALNDAFNGGMTALQAKQYDQAVESFVKAAEMDPKQHVIWGNMAEAYVQGSTAKAGPDRDAWLAKGYEAYTKAIELVPTDANYRNNFALALAKGRKFDEMQQQLAKAVELDPTNGGKYYFNLGAVLTNNQQTDAACAAFKKAIEADAKYAEAHYQYGICLTAKATADKDGKLTFPDGTAQAFQAYLELAPTGPNAESAKGMLATMGQKIETEYRAPGAGKKQPEPKTRKK